MRNCGRLARAAASPRAIIFGLATFQFGWALVPYMRPHESPYYNADTSGNLFLIFALLLASVGLLTRGAWGNLLAAALSSPIPLIHGFIFWASASRAEVTFLSGAHLRAWLTDLSDIPSIILMATGLSVAILVTVAVSTLRRTV